MSEYEISTGFHSLGPPLELVSRCPETLAFMAVIDPKRHAGALVTLGHFTILEAVKVEERDAHLRWAIMDGITETPTGDYDTQLLIQMPGFFSRAVARAARYQEPRATVYGSYFPLNKLSN